MKTNQTSINLSCLSRYMHRQSKSLGKVALLLLIQIVFFGGQLRAQDPNLPPSGNFELIDWKVTLPDQTEIKEQQLSSGFESPNEFYTDPSTGAMVFRCPNNGATGGSTYPRSELREMLRAGNTSISTSGIGLNNWVFSTSSQSNQDASGGVDGTLTATVAVDHVSTSGTSSMIGRVIIGQIHAGTDEPCRLYYRKLPGNTKGSIYIAHEPGNGNPEQWYDMIGSRSSSASDPADGIALGEQFSYEIKVVGNTLTVTISRPGKPDAVEIVDMSNSGFANDWMYFKAGCYNQNNSGNSGDYAQVSFFALSNTHSSAGNSAPTASVTAPSNGATFNGGDNITITANASDSDGSITKVEFFQGSTKLGEDTSSPYSFTWNNVSAGSYNLTATATDNGGATGSSSAVSITVNSAPNPDPTTSITAPANGASFNAGDNITISASASDSDGSINKVEFFQGATKLGEDLSAPYSFTWNNVGAGNYNLTSVATDNLGATGTSSIVSISVNSGPNANPTTSITAPANGTSFTAGDNITINADASDSDGTIAKVEFYQGATKLGEDLSAPYSFTWNNVSAGSYDLTSVATDNVGATGASSVVSISVATGPPTNVALNKSVTVSSEQASNPGSNLVDGDPDSRWSASGFPQWVQVDLGSTHSISSTELVCFSDRAYQFIVEVSTNGSSYSTIVDRSSNTTPGTNSAPITDNFAAVDARYVKITVSGAASYSGSWVSLEELRVFGTEGAGQSVPVTGVSVTPASATIIENDTQQLSVSVSPSNASNQDVTYSSSNASVATVSASGLVTAVSAGSATITVTTDDGAFTDTSVITVESSSGGSWTVISSEDFESGWGIWNDGGSDASLYTGGTYAHQGSAALNIENNSSSSVVTTNDLSLASYADLKVDFWFMPVGMNNGHDFWLQVSTDGGSNYTTVQSWVIDGSNYQNDNFYQESVELLGYGLNDQTRVRFRCDGNNDSDDVYLDEIVISAKGSASRTTSEPELSQALLLQSRVSKIYPNPVRGKMLVEYELADDSHVVISVLNLSGQVIAQLENGPRSAGAHTLEWDASSTSGAPLPKGMYLVRFNLNGENQVKRILISE